MAADQIGPVAIGKGAIHHRSPRGIEAVAAERRTPVAGNERDLESLQISGADVAHADKDPAIVLVRADAFDRDLVTERRAGGGEKTGHAGRHYAGQPLDLRDQPFLHVADSCTVLVPRRANMEGHRVIRAKAGIHVLEVVEAAQQQPGGRREDDAERNLRHDEQLLKAVTHTRRSTIALGEQRIDICARRMQRRPQAEHDGGGGAGADAERQRTPVERQLGGARDVGKRPGEQHHQRARQSRADSRSGRRNQDDFLHDRADDVHARSADCLADGQLARAAAQLHEHQAGNVRHRNGK